MKYRLIRWKVIGQMNYHFRIYYLTKDTETIRKIKERFNTNVSVNGESIEGKMVELYFTIINEKAPVSIFIDLKSEQKNLLMREKIYVPLGRTSFSLILQ